MFESITTINTYPTILFLTYGLINRIHLYIVLFRYLFRFGAEFSFVVF